MLVKEIQKGGYNGGVGSDPKIGNVLVLLGYRFFYMSSPPDPMYILLDGIALGIKSLFIIKKTFPYSLI